MHQNMLQFIISTLFLDLPKFTFAGIFIKMNLCLLFIYMRYYCLIFNNFIVAAMFMKFLETTIIKIIL